jgi:tetraacyldisaccharide 4'-kinase
MTPVGAWFVWTARCMAGDTNWAGRAWLTTLRPLSWIYGGLVSMRTVAFASGLVGTRRLSVPVVSVGNVVAGGAGKTPFVELLARRLHERGCRVAIVLRGYRGASTGPAVVSNGRALLAEPPLASDEAYLLARRLPGIAVLTGADRYLAGQIAVEELGADVIALDDGFQHLRLHRDLNIVLLDATNPFGYGRLLPSGLLREPLISLARADLVILTYADLGSDLDGVARRIRRYAPDVPILHAVHHPSALLGVRGEVLPPERLQGQRLLAFSGIANPRRFEETLARLGAIVLGHRMLPDHHVYSSEDLESLASAARASGASLMITTEKDLVKLSHLGPQNGGVPLYALSIQFELLDARAVVDGMLNGMLRSGA